MAQINVYLMFDGDCREAMTFYKEALGGVLDLQTVGESPMAQQWPAAVANHILHASLVNDSIRLYASDMSAGPEKRVQGNTISLSLNCEPEEDIQAFFARLSAGGQVIRPLHEFFAGTIGLLTDKFGFTWMFHQDKKKA